MKKVLHIVESFGGGVSSALRAYVVATPEVEHHVLKRVREGDYKDGGEISLFKSVHELSESHFKAIGDVKKAVRLVNPDLIHAHSSFAGGYVRVAVRSRKSRPILYTPHCYAFERLDLSAAKRLAFKLMEYVLAVNTSTIVACAPHEARALKGILAPQSIYVPNVSSLIKEPVEDSFSTESINKFDVVGSGRMAPQRGPDFFSKVAKELVSSEVGDSYSVGWIGGDDSNFATTLRESGVKLTGWLSQPEAVQTVSEAGIYLHTAAWDGFPMSVLEAVSCGVPVLVRNSVAFADAPVSVRFDAPDQMAQAATEILSGGSGAVAENLSIWRNYLSENQAKTQKERLLMAYQVNE